MRRNVVDTSHLEVEYEVDPRLKKLIKRDKYSSMTQLYWDTWANSEQAQWFSPTDWMRLQQMAILMEKYVKTQSHFVMAELRQNESLLGATIADRMRLKVHALKSNQQQQLDAPPTIEADLELYAELND
jgi:hypothetical protein